MYSTIVCMTNTYRVKCDAEVQKTSTEGEEKTKTSPTTEMLEPSEQKAKHLNILWRCERWMAGEYSVYVSVFSYSV